MTHVMTTGKGRHYIYVPAFLRNMFDLDSTSKLAISTDGERIIIQKVG